MFGRTSFTPHNRKRRSRKGSILVLAAIIAAFVLIPLALIVGKSCLLLTEEQRYQQCMSAAALEAAGELSKVIINDPHFGFVSLTNQAPIGPATAAADGEPCPVTSINTLLATIRLDEIIAHELCNDDLATLADDDYRKATSTESVMQASLKAAVQNNPAKQLRDMNGDKVEPYKAALSMLQNNLAYSNNGCPVPIRNLRITIGWLKTGGITQTPVPQPISLARLGHDSQLDGRYRACVDVPAFGKSFYFAAVGKTPALVNETDFVPGDGHRFCSVVKIEADIEDCRGGSPLSANQWLHVAACAVPNESQKLGPTGALLVFFPCGQVDQFKCLADLISLPNITADPARFYQAQNGDLPGDSEAVPIEGTFAPFGNSNISAPHVVSTGLYCWLRNASIRPRIDATVTAMLQNFKDNLQGTSLLYEFTPNGSVIISSLPAMPLPIGVLSDQQLFVECRGDNFSIGCYNNVYNLGTISGGKHAGQPLEGDPINWCDLPYFGMSPDTAKCRGKGSATGLEAYDSLPVDSTIAGAIENKVAQFEVNGKLVTAQPRKSYYSGGLAVELSISAI